ncbi:MAG: hypothetical protein H6642_01620 [Caldilineaceae bacterium]|nr:hypothetical protein [Caldilineaceae bacterium]
MPLPRFAPIRQSVTTDRIEDIPGHVRAELLRAGLTEEVKPNQRIAIGVGSRGIDCITDVVMTVIQALQEAGAEPFLVPAMGSHGGGTPQGQREVLQGYGLGEEATGAPILSSMDVVEIGVTPGGMPVVFDAHAAGADGVLVINRIKPHTAFREQWESGLFKMLAVGLGKERGAAAIHGWGIAEAMPAAARVVIREMPILGGVAIVENGCHQPAHIEAIPASQIEAREPELLKLAWRHLPRIPLEPLDLLILQEIGKDISGTGMDPNVVGMWRRKGGVVEPDFRALVALDLTPHSHGNAIGVGYCDLIPQRLRDKIDPGPTYTNCLTSGNYNGGKIPITLPHDRAVIESALAAVSPDRARVVIVRNTMTLDRMWVSEALLEDVAGHALLSQTGRLGELAFDEAGGLRELPVG